jgi:Protein of unknown function (DUF3292)
MDTVKDMLPVPDNTIPVSDPDHKDLANSLTEEPTLSHQLAMQDHDLKGAAQKDHDVEEVANLGWNESADQIANPLVGGIKNEDLWVLVRRFNQVLRSILNLIIPSNRVTIANVSSQRRGATTCREA